MLISASFCKKSEFFDQNNTYTQSNNVRVLLEKKRLPDCSKLAINWKNGNDVTIFGHDIIVKLFRRGFVSVVKFSYWSKFHLNIFTGSGVITIFFCTGLTRNAKIGNTPVCILPNIWKLGRVGNTKFGTKVSNKMLLNAAKCQGYSCDHFWVIKGKPTGGGVKLLPPTLPD